MLFNCPIFKKGVKMTSFRGVMCQTISLLGAVANKPVPKM